MGNKSYSMTERLYQETTAWGETSSDGHFENFIRNYYRVAVDNPKFRNAIVSHSNATNPMTVDSRNVDYIKGTLTVKMIDPNNSSFGKTMTTHRLQNYVVSAGLPSSAFVSSVANKALVGIYKKARVNMQSGFSGPTFLVELRELVSTIRNPFSTFRKQTQRLIAKRVKNKRPTKNFVSDSWLEWTYGVAPSIRDIAEISTLLNDKLSKASEGHRLSFRYTDTYYGQANDSFFPTGTTCNVITTRRGSYGAGVQYIVWIDPGFIGLEGFHYPASNLVSFGRFDLGEILPTVWEAVPWSFLIDYVTNIGDLAACTYDLNSYVKWVCKTTNTFGTQRVFKQVATPYDPNVVEVVGLEPARWNTEVRRVIREAPSELGFPKFEFSLPNLGQIHNSAQLLLAQISNSSSKWR